jgi:hypothetical protein
VASLRKLGWYKGQIAPMVELWERSLRAVNASRARLAADQLLEIRYEDLVTAPEATLSRVTAFAGLADDDAAVGQMLSYHEYEEKRSKRYHANLRRPLDRSRLAAWRDALERTEIAFIEEAAGPLMRPWGYEPAAHGASPPPELLEEFARRRRRYAAAQRKRATKDKLSKLVLHRRPLAAEPAVPLRPAKPAARPTDAGSKNVQYH